MAANLDLHSTFVKIATGQPPKKQVVNQKGYISLDLTGTLLRGEQTPRNQWYYNSGGAIAFRSGPFKIHLSSKDRSSNPDTRAREPIATHETPLLFHLENDVSESNDLSAGNAERILQLRKEMEVFLSADSN